MMWWKSLSKGEGADGENQGGQDEEGTGSAREIASGSSEDRREDFSKQPSPEASSEYLAAAESDQIETDSVPRPESNGDDELDETVEEDGEDSFVSAQAPGIEAGLEFEQDDPVSEAYDLQREGGLDTGDGRGRHGALPWRSKVKSAKEFFNSEILYRFDIMEPEQREVLVGRYRVELKGYNGGVWTISVGEELDIANRQEDADIVFSMDHRDFLHIVNGNLNPQLAVLARKVRIQGDMRKAVLFQSLIAPVSE